MIEISNAAPAIDRLIWLRDIGNRLADYKARYDKNPDENTNAQKWPFAANFDTKRAGNFDPETVTFCRVVIPLNQLGNIMYGIMAHDLNVVSEARAYGQGKFATPDELRDAAKKAGLKIGPNEPSPNWLAEGQGYRAAAFELGVKYAEKTAWDTADTALMQRYVKRGFRNGKVVDQKDQRSLITDSPDLKGKNYKPSTVKYTGPQTDIKNHIAWELASDGNIKK